VRRLFHPHRAGRQGLIAFHDQPLQSLTTRLKGNPMNTGAIVVILIIIAVAAFSARARKRRDR